MPSVDYTALWNLNEEDVVKYIQGTRFKTPKPVYEGFERNVVGKVVLADHKPWLDACEAAQAGYDNLEFPILCSDEHLERVYGENAQNSLLTTMVHSDKWYLVLSSRLVSMLHEDDCIKPSVMKYLIAHELGKWLSGYYWYHYQDEEWPEVCPNDPVWPDNQTDMERTIKIVAGGVCRDRYEADRYAAAIIGLKEVLLGLSFLMTEAAITLDLGNQMEIHNRIVHHIRNASYEDYFVTPIHHTLCAGMECTDANDLDIGISMNDNN